MFIFANFISAAARVLDALLTVYMWVLIARAIISWVNPDPYNPIVRFLYQATEPVLGRVRRLLPFMGGLDVSPIVVILAIYFIQWFVVSTLLDVAFKLKAAS
ncbi:MAG: YggT family protein [Deltaproteobacteria bacterium]|jgi:YggT family protein